MVEMSNRFTLPPAIRRFGRCGGWEHQILAPSSSEIEKSSQSVAGGYQNEPRHPSSFRGAQSGTERVKSFVNGIVLPFTACWQPSENSCVPGCAPVRIFEKQPAVVSPNGDRLVAHRDSRVEFEQGEYSRHARRRHHPPAHIPAASRTGDVDGANHPTDPGTATVRGDKRKRSTEIANPRSDDILCGRGGSSNRHVGNIHFRELVAANKQIYVGLTKKQKMSVARKIVDAIHSTGGRFLAKDLDTGFFYDIGLPRSLEKTSQALREKHSNEMQVQRAEDEGIETSVESHNSVIKNNTSSHGMTDRTEESPTGASSSSKSTSKSVKKMEAPSLVIPSHLMKKFGQKGSRAYEEDWEKNHQHVHSLRGYYSSQSPYESRRSLYPPSPHLTHHNYQQAPGHPPAQLGHHHRHRPPYTISPVSSVNQYPPHPHYYYHGPPSQSPPYSRHGRGHDEGYPYPAREHELCNSEHYSRSTDYKNTSTSRFPHAMSPPARYHRFSSHHPSPRPNSHPILSGLPHSSAPSTPLSPDSSYGHHSSSSSIPTYRHTQQSPPHYYRYEKEDSSPSLLLPHDNSPSKRISYRTTKSGYDQRNLDTSLVHQRGLKRQRNGVGHTTRSSDAMLSSAVKKSLSLDERVVGREREKHQGLQEATSAGGSIGNTGKLDLISPSTILQAKSSSRCNTSAKSGRCSPTEKKEDYSTLSGLAALSTAAFLKLDEDEEKDVA